MVKLKKFEKIRTYGFLIVISNVFNVRKHDFGGLQLPRFYVAFWTFDGQNVDFYGFFNVF